MRCESRYINDWCVAFVALDTVHLNEHSKGACADGHGFCCTYG